MAWARNGRSFDQRTFIEVNAAFLPVEVRLVIFLDPGGLNHVFRRSVNIVTGRTGRVCLTFLKDASLRLVTRDRNALLFASRLVKRLYCALLIIVICTCVMIAELRGFWLVGARAWHQLLLLEEILTARYVQLLFNSLIHLVRLLNNGADFGPLHDYILQ